jgi:hypothetical protein
MKISKAHLVRSVIREILSVSFWFHALYIFRILPDWGKISLSTASHSYNSALLIFVLYYSYFTDSGWLSVLYDILYIYVWPFVCIVRVCLLLTKKSYHFAKEQIHFPKLGLITKPVQNASAGIAESANTEETPSATLTTLAAAAGEQPFPWNTIFRPINHFAILCSLFVFTLHNFWLLLGVVAVAAYGAVKAVGTLWSLVSDMVIPLDKAKDLFAKVLSLNMTHVLSWKEKAGSEKVTDQVNALSLYETCLAFIEENRGFWSRCTLALSVLLAIPFYLYVSFLMSCVYYGISKMVGVQWNWPSAIIDSLFMPVAFGDLPHVHAIQFVAGLHCIVLGVIGWNVVFRQIGKKLEDVVAVASELRNPLRDEKLQSQISRIKLVASRTKSSNVNKALPEKGFRKPPSRSRKTSNGSKKYSA